MENEILDFLEFFFKFNPHFYQRDFLRSCVLNKRVVGKWARQSGKSTAIGAYIAYVMATTSKTVGIIAPTQNQADELFNKARDFIIKNSALKQLIIKDTSNELKFKNHARLIALPVGNEGRTIRGYTVDIIILEEAQGIPDNVVNSVIIPMIASKKVSGQIIKIGTPFLKNHFYESCFNDDKYSVHNVNWQDCVKCGQFSEDFINEQRENLTEIEFQLEYEANFVEMSNRFFLTSLIKSCQADYDLIKII